MEDKKLSIEPYLQQAADILEISHDDLLELVTPNRTIEMTIPVEIQGQKRLYHGYRVQHNNRLGPYKGGLRYHPDVDMAEARLLARLMTWKNAVADLPLGGGKGGITVNPKELSKNELEQLTRSFTRRLADVIGPDRDIPAPDVNTTAEVMRWIRDEYEQITGQSAPGVVTGKPMDVGGSAGREEATGEGGAVVLNAVVKYLGRHPKDLTVAIQGFGNVGTHLAKALERDGYKIVALSNSRGGIYHPDGLNITETYHAVQWQGEDLQKTCYCTPGNCSIDDCRLVSNEELLELPVDILIPAAIDNQITGTNADKIKAEIILEMANNPTTPEADDFLTHKKKIIIPDILANAGGVIVSYFEWLQNKQNQSWSKEDVLQKLHGQLEKATQEVVTRQEKYTVSLRVAAYILALERLIAKQ